MTNCSFDADTLEQGNFVSATINKLPLVITKSEIQPDQSHITQSVVKLTNIDLHHNHVAVRSN